MLQASVSRSWHPSSALIRLPDSVTRLKLSARLELQARQEVPIIGCQVLEEAQGVCGERGVARLNRNQLLVLCSDWKSLRAEEGRGWVLDACVHSERPWVTASSSTHAL